MWIARDKDGKLFVYGCEPVIRKAKEFVCAGNENSDYDDWCELNPKEFPEVTWENSPVEIKSLKGVENV